MRPAVTALASTLLLVAAGCAPSSSGAPPLKICGTTLYRGASGAVVTDATRSGPVVGLLTGGGAPLVVLRLADGCSRGAAFTVRPAAAARVGKVAYARDHRPVAVVLRVGRTPGQVAVQHRDGSSAIVRIFPDP